MISYKSKTKTARGSWYPTEAIELSLTDYIKMPEYKAMGEIISLKLRYGEDPFGQNGTHHEVEITIEQNNGKKTGPIIKRDTDLVYTYKNKH